MWSGVCSKFLSKRTKRDEVLITSQLHVLKLHNHKLKMYPVEGVGTIGNAGIGIYRVLPNAHRYTVFG